MIGRRPQHQITGDAIRSEVSSTGAPRRLSLAIARFKVSCKPASSSGRAPASSRQPCTIATSKRASTKPVRIAQSQAKRLAGEKVGGASASPGAAAISWTIAVLSNRATAGAGAVPLETV